MRWYGRMKAVYSYLNSIKNEKKDEKKNDNLYEKQYIVIARHNEAGGFQYAAFDYDNFVEEYSRITNDLSLQVYWYECITDGNPLHYYLDIDKIQTGADLTGILYAISIVKAAFIRYLNYEVKEDEIIILMCRRDQQDSFHVHFNTSIAFKDNYQLGYFQNVVYKLLWSEYSNHMKWRIINIDNKVYQRHQLMRLGNSGKTPDNPTIFQIVEIYGTFDGKEEKIIYKEGCPIELSEDVTIAYKAYADPDKDVYNQRISSRTFGNINKKIPLRILRKCLMNASRSTPIFPDLARNPLYIETHGIVYYEDADFERFSRIFVGKVFGKVSEYELKMYATDIRGFEDTMRAKQLFTDLVDAHKMDNMVNHDITYGSNEEEIQDDPDDTEFNSEVTSADAIWSKAVKRYFKIKDLNEYITRIEEKYRSYATVNITSNNREYKINIPKGKIGRIYYTEIFDGRIIFTVFNKSGTTSVTIDSAYDAVKFHVHGMVGTSHVPFYGQRNRYTCADSTNLESVIIQMNINDGEGIEYITEENPRDIMISDDIVNIPSSQQPANPSDSFNLKEVSSLAFENLLNILSDLTTPGGDEDTAQNNEPEA